MLDSDIRTSESLSIFKSKVLQFIQPKANYMLFYKDHFYKQLLTEIGKKWSKYEATPRGWTFAIWKLFSSFIHIIVQK